MHLIIISGPEATGKSEIARNISEQLGLIYESKDRIKEVLFDEGSRTTWDYSWYENEAKQQFFQAINRFVSNGTDAVIESNFIGKDKANLKKCLSSGVQLTEIYCTAEGMTSFLRFVRRNESGRRHKGHHDRRWYVKVLVQDCLRLVHIRWPYEPLRLADKFLEVDTTSFSQVDFHKITAFVQSK